MSEQSININVNARGIRRTTRQMNGLSRSMRGAGLSAAAAAVSMGVIGNAATRMTGGLIKSADAYTNLKNQTKVFATTSGSAAFKMQSTIDIARKMNSSLSEVGQVYQRISMIQGGAGFGDETAAKIVENLTKAVKLSGATAQEAEGALRQFSQGMAANRLSGQELNSVLEQTPMIAQLIAEGMGKPVGALRELGKQGKITTDVLVRIFGGSIDNLDEKFKKFTFTLEANLVSIRREMQLFAGMMMHSSGIAGQLGKLLKEQVTDRLVKMNETLQKGGPEAAKIMETIEAVTYGVATAFGIAAIAATAFFLATPFGQAAVIIAAIGAMVAALYKFRNSGIEVAGSFVTVGDVVMGIFNGLKTAGQLLVDGMVDQFGRVWQTVQTLADLGVKAFNALTSIASDALSTAFTDLMNLINDVLRGMDRVWQFAQNMRSGMGLSEAWDQSALDVAGKNYTDDLFAGAQSGAKTLAELMPALDPEKWKAAYERLKQTASTETPKLMKLLSEQFENKPLEDAAPLVDDPLAALGLGKDDSADNIKKGTAEKDLQKGLDFVGKMDPAYGLERDYESDKSMVETAMAVADPDQIKLMEEALNLRKEQYDMDQLELEHKTAMTELNAGLIDQTLTMGELGVGVAASMAEGFGKVAEQTMNVSGQIANITSQAIGGLSNEIANLATTGDGSFKQLGRSFVTMITQMIVKLVVMMGIIAAISAIPGGSAVLQMMGMGAPGGGAPAAGGGGLPAAGSPGTGPLANSQVTNSGTNFFGFAAGGPVTGGTPILVGERGPELFVPPQSGSIKNNTTTQGMMGQQAPQVTVVNVDSTENTLDALGSEEGESIIMNVIQRNPEILRSIG